MAWWAWEDLVVLGWLALRPDAPAVPGGGYRPRMESVDYLDSFITVAPDSTASGAAVPRPRGGTPTVASATFALVSEHPYRWRSSEVIFTVWADRRGIPETGREAAWAEFFDQPRACLRASELCKKFGWGIHADHDGRVALYPVDSDTYRALATGRTPDGCTVKVMAAMRSRR